eukprot:CAMPEP_0195051864 /NCGR_PEP_ID=MMETSP0448-20130528/1296_1 /TAXON_ID=66468 /ORGANISM="Heterocapsa triquestra, Strain CCMP 448" /LENGTH=136 /DNA_ID=CAMNT_0040080903 /DNA_START=64 /DNA_END=470 /DNA_ORIENTATION=-
MFSCKAVCGPMDPTTDTVKVDIAAQVEAERQAAEEAQRRHQEAELDMQRKALCAIAEQEARRQKEAEARRVQAERELQAERERQAEEARRAEELSAQEARRREAEEAARRAEEERIAQEKHKAAVAAFLKEYGFTG